MKFWKQYRWIAAGLFALIALGASVGALIGHLTSLDDEEADTSRPAPAAQVRKEPVNRTTGL